MWLVGYAPICPPSPPTGRYGPRFEMVFKPPADQKEIQFCGIYIYIYIYSGGYSYQGWSIEQGYGHTTLLRKVTRVINGCLKRWLNVNGYIRRHKHTHSLAEGTDKQSTVL